MATSVGPNLLKALIESATALLPGVLVLDGVGVTNDPGDYLMIGVDDPTKPVPTAITSTEEFGAFGSTRPRFENGSVFMTAFSWNGDADQEAARDAVYAIAGVLSDSVRPNDLAVPGLMSLGFGESSELRQAQTEYGAGAELSFSVKFQAQI
ncbi:MAG: hypothetical protein AB7G17_14365 [Phycisphaerales bacterium]